MERWWPMRLPQRVLMMCELLLLPLRAASMAVELVVGLGIVAAVALAWGIHAGMVPQAVAGRLLGSAGAGILAMLRAQGLY